MERAKSTELIHTVDYGVRKAMSEKPLVDYDRAAISTQLSKLLNIAHAKLGHTSNDKAITNGEIIDDILDNPLNKKLTYTDVEMAITRGLREIYGKDFVLINVPVINRFINGWKGETLEPRKRMRAIDEQKQLPECITNDNLESIKRKIIAMGIEYGKLDEEKKASEIGKQVKETIETLEYEYAELYQKNRYENFVNYLDKNKKVPLFFEFDVVFLHLERIKEIQLSNYEKGQMVSLMHETLKKEAEKHRLDKGKYTDLLREANDANTLKRECRKKEVLKWAELYIKTSSEL